jgi:hypothetical protein
MRTLIAWWRQFFPKEEIVETQPVPKEKRRFPTWDDYVC